MRYVFLCLALAGCATDPAKSTSSSDVTVCLISMCTQTHVLGTSDDNEQTSSPDNQVEVSPIP